MRNRVLYRVIIFLALLVGITLLVLTAENLKAQDESYGDSGYTDWANNYYNEADWNTQQADYYAQLGDYTSAQSYTDWANYYQDTANNWWDIGTSGSYDSGYYPDYYSSYDSGLSSDAGYSY